MFGEIFGLQECPTCGTSVPTPFLEDGSHVCRADRVLTHQVEQAHRSMARLEQEVAEYLETDRARKLAAFNRWCVEHGR